MAFMENNKSAMQEIYQMLFPDTPQKEFEILS